MRWIEWLFHKAVQNQFNHSVLPKKRKTDLRVEQLEHRIVPNVTGTVFRDFNLNGTQDALEPGVDGIQVTATDTAGNTAVATTANGGTYNINTAGLTGTSFRLTFDNIPTFFQPGVVSGATGSTVQFIADGSVANLGLNNPADYTSNNRLLVTNRYIFGDQLTQTVPVLLEFDYDANGTTNALNTTNLATSDQIGTTYGLAYQSTSNSLYASSFMKRHSGFGPNGLGGTTTGGIYRVNRSNGQVSLLIDLNNLPVNLVPTGSTAANFATGADPHPTGANPNFFNDVNSFDAVGKISLGDLELSEDGRTLYTVNLATKELIEIPINLDGTLDTTRTLQRSGIPLPANGGRPDDIRPFALGIKDGVVYVGLTDTAQSTANVDTFVDANGNNQYDRGEGFNDANGNNVFDVGEAFQDLNGNNQFDPGEAFTDNDGNGIFNSGDSSQLRIFVFTFDPVNRTFGATPVLSAPMNYQRGYADFEDFAPGEWRAWTSTFRTFEGSLRNDVVIYQQPLLSDIVFDSDGSMILGIRDRLGDQVGYQSGSTNVADPTLYNAIAPGDILRAGRNVNGTFTLEANGTAGGVTTAGAGNFQGPGGGEYYFGDLQDPANPANARHQELSVGGLAQVAGLPDLVSTAIDPLPASFLFAGGTIRINNATGARNLNANFQVYDGNPANNNFGKANGVGDLEVVSDPAPIEIGNRIFRDTNNNGLQDAGENGIPNVVVELFDVDGNQSVGTVTTDTNGEFLFNATTLGTAILRNRNYQIRVAANQANLQGLVLTTQNVNNNSQDTLDSDADSTTNVGQYTVVLQTGGAGANNHTFDIGLTTPPQLFSVGNQVFFDANNNGIFDNVNGIPEVGVAGVLLNLFAADVNGNPTGNILLSVQTDVTGRYRFDGVAPGNYVIQVAASNFQAGGPLVGYLSSTQTAAQGNQVDSLDNGINNGTPEANAIFSSLIRLGTDPTPTGEDRTDPAAGSIAGTGGASPDAFDNLTIDFGFYGLRIGNQIWQETDGDGIFEMGETPIVGLDVQLLDSNGNIVNTTQTDINGRYTFVTNSVGSPLQEIPYRIRIPNPPANLNVSTTFGLNGGDNTNKAEAGPPVQTPLFTIVGGQTTNGAVLNVADGTTTNNTLDIGFTGQSLLTGVGNFVFRDLNGNGIQDPTEPGVGQVIITLLDANGTPVGAPTVSAPGTGFYQFNNLQPGTYQLAFDLSSIPDGTAFTITGQGDATNDSDPDPNTGITAPFTLQAGIFDNTRDAGLVPLSSLAGSVYFDANNDGIRQPGETGIQGVTILLTGTDNLGNTVNRNATTDFNGDYIFSDLRPGTYSVSQPTQPNGFNDGQETPGSVGGIAGNETITQINLPANTQATGYNFGEIQGGTIPGDTTDVQIVQTISNTNPRVGDVITLTYIVTNNGPNTANNLLATMPLPPTLVPLSINSITQGVFDPNTGMWMIGGLPVGAQVVLSIQARVVGAGNVTSPSFVSASNAETTLANNLSPVSLVTPPDPSGVSKQDFLSSDPNVFVVLQAPTQAASTVSNALLAGAPGAGAPPLVQVFDRDTGVQRLSFYAYDRTFTGGVNVTLADVNGDGTADIITGAGATGGPHLKVFDGLNGGLLYSFFAYDPSFSGGLSVAAVDINGDNRADIITGAGLGGGPHVKVFDGATGTLLQSFFAYDPQYTGGVNVAGGDVNNDGVADIITGSANGASHIRVFSGDTLAELQSFFAYLPEFVGGVRVAVGDVDGDGTTDIITGAGFGGGPHVKAFRSGTEIRSFFAFDPNFLGGITVASTDADGDGVADILTGVGSAGPSTIRTYNGSTLALIDEFLAQDPSFLGGVRFGASA